MVNSLGQHAVVIGGSLAGLMTARVLADHFDHVTVLERDEIEDRPIIHKSIPQGNHLHGLLQGGQQVLSSLYPGFTGELRTLGATRAMSGRDIVWYLPDGKAYNPTGSLRAPLDLGFEAHCASRGAHRIPGPTADPGTTECEAETGITVHELAQSGGHVQGVRCSGSRAFAAELVVDAGGRALVLRNGLRPWDFRRPMKLPSVWTPPTAPRTSAGPRPTLVNRSSS